MSKQATAGVCRKCGCTEADCTDCVERTGRPCVWVEPGLCSACLPRFDVLDLVVVSNPRFGSTWLYVTCDPGGDPEEQIGQPGWTGPLPPVVLVELHLPPDLYAIARRLLPRLAKQGRLTL